MLSTTGKHLRFTYGSATQMPLFVFLINLRLLFFLTLVIQKRGRLVSLRINHVEHGDNRHHRVTKPIGHI